MRRDLPILPDRMRFLPLDHRGYLVPWFVEWIDNKPDFRVTSTAKILEAFKYEKCWICGKKLASYKAFVIGPMCGINLTSSEPPSHRECAEFAVKACPFMLKPQMTRNDKDLPSESKDAAGIMIKRNPGVTLIYMTKTYKPFISDSGMLFEIGDCTSTAWYCEGRAATFEEVEESIKSGIHILVDQAKKDGPQGMKLLEKLIADSYKLMPGQSYNRQ